MKTAKPKDRTPTDDAEVILTAVKQYWILCSSLLDPGAIEGKKVSVRKFLKIKKDISEKILPQFQTTVCSVLELKKMPVGQLKNIVDGILFKSGNLGKKYDDKNFYVQNANAFMVTVEAVLSKTNMPPILDTAEEWKRKKPRDYITEACIKDHLSTLWLLCFDSKLLIQDMLDWKKIQFEPLGGKASHRNPRLMYGDAAAVLYGEHCSFSSLPLSRCYAGTTLLRVAIETKIRMAFGIIGCWKEDEKKTIHISLGEILNVVNSYVNDGSVLFEVDYHTLRNIYSWANIYTHSGYLGFSWYPFVCHKYLGPLFNGFCNAKHRNIHAGIVIHKKETLASIRKDLERMINSKGGGGKNPNSKKRVLLYQDHGLQAVLLES